MVLEAWIDAEKVWYPVVWEEIKDASNIVDYNINDEITKDTSWVINANNQTTTGMATVIPGVNAPKLIASTSITWIPDDWNYYSTVSAYLSTPPIYVPAGWTSENVSSNWWTLISETWYYSWIFNSRWLVVPASWWYKIEVRPYTTGYWTTDRYTEIYAWDQLLWTMAWSWYTNTYYANVKKGDTLWYKSYMTSTDSSSRYITLSAKFDVTKWW